MTDKRYLIIVVTTSIAFPLIALGFEAEISFLNFCKWFVFFAVGVRLLIAGLKQVFQPQFTARQIFRIETDAVFPIIRELGFANICFGLIGLASIALPEWRIVSAFGSGIYYALAGILHLVKKPESSNEKLALVSDFYIAAVLLIYVVVMLSNS